MKHFAGKYVIALLLLAPAALFAGENLKINPHLDYSSDSQDGPLITGDHMQDGAVAGKPAYIMMYGEGWFNSKRQARRSVELYEKYRDRVQFVIIDLDKQRSKLQQELVKKYFSGSIPHIVVLDPKGDPIYNRAGEVDSGKISDLLDKQLQ
jgi:hypothetical protein